MESFYEIFKKNKSFQEHVITTVDSNKTFFIIFQIDGREYHYKRDKIPLGFLEAVYEKFPDGTLNLLEDFEVKKLYNFFKN